jgi:hypothetical protein
VYDRDEFLFCVVLLVVVGGRSWRRNDVGKEKTTGEAKTSIETEESRDDRLKSNQQEQDDRRVVIPSRHRGKKRDPEEETLVRNPNTVAVAAAVPPSSAENEVLNRYQTEEWKGWMQYIFLLYHYMHATEAYNGIRVLITCYVFLTGFGKSSC